jgi:hypothetical protein
MMEISTFTVAGSFSQRSVATYGLWQSVAFNNAAFCMSAGKRFP